MWLALLGVAVMGFVIYLLYRNAPPDKDDDVEMHVPPAKYQLSANGVVTEFSSLQPQASLPKYKMHPGRSFTYNNSKYTVQPDNTATDGMGNIIDFMLFNLIYNDILFGDDWPADSAPAAEQSFDAYREDPPAIEQPQVDEPAVSEPVAVESAPEPAHYSAPEPSYEPPSYSDHSSSYDSGPSYDSGGGSSYDSGGSSDCGGGGGCDF